MIWDTPLRKKTIRHTYLPNNIVIVMFHRRNGHISRIRRQYHRQILHHKNIKTAKRQKTMFSFLYPTLATANEIYSKHSMP